MRKKLAIPVIAAVAAMAVAAAAFAAAAQNSYTVTGSVSPTKAGTFRSPRPVGFGLTFHVSGPNGGPPAVVQTYKVGIYGLRVANARYFPSCTNFGSSGATDRACKPSSVIGTGKVFNTLYDPNNTSNQTACNKSLKVYNSTGRRGPEKATLYIYVAAGDCTAGGNVVIPVTFKKERGGGNSLNFTVPSNVRHPLPAINLAINATQVNIRDLTTRARVGTRVIRRHHRVVRRVPVFRRVGLVEKVNCLSRRSPISVTFTEENGGSATAGFNGVACG